MGYVESSINLPDIPDPQKLGSAITYLEDIHYNHY